MGHSAHVTNVRFSHDDRKLVSVGGADTSVMIWAHNAGSREPASDETNQSADPTVTSSAFSSEDSDTDSEEEGELLWGVACETSPACGGKFTRGRTVHVPAQIAE